MHVVYEWQSLLFILGSSSQSNCLKDTSSVTVNQLSDNILLLGQNYSLDHQCTLLFGKEAKACLKTVRETVCMLII